MPLGSVVVVCVIAPELSVVYEYFHVPPPGASCCSVTSPEESYVFVSALTPRGSVMLTSSVQVSVEVHEAQA